MVAKWDIFEIVSFLLSILPSYQMQIPDTYDSGIIILV